MEQSIEEFEKELEEESLQDLESDVVGQLLSAAGADGEDPESKMAAKERWESPRSPIALRNMVVKMQTGASGGTAVPC